MKFKVGDKVRVVSNTFENSSLEVGTVGTVTRIRFGASFPIIVEGDNGLEEFFKESELDLYVRGNKMEKTFREVIADIKYMQLWICRNCKFTNEVRIFKDKTGIQITDEHNNSIKWFSDEWKFELKRKGYAFNEAFKEYEQGKVIESSYGFRYKKIGDEDYVYDDELEQWVENEESFAINEIREEWFIEG